MDRKELKNKIVNLFCETFVKYPDDADHYEHWREHIADEFIAAGLGDVRVAVKEFAESVKMAFYYEFDELIPSTMADKIDELIKEVCNDEVSKNDEA